MHGERSRVLPWLCLFLNRADLPSYVAWVCDRPFTTVNLGAVQGLVFVKCACHCMMTENGSLAVRPQATALTSVSLMGGKVNHSESGSSWSLWWLCHGVLPSCWLWTLVLWV